MGKKKGGAADVPAAPAAEKPKRAPRGHRQKGAGTTQTGKGTIVVSGVAMKEWQRTPKQLVHEYCQRQKRPKPRYYQDNGKPAPGGSGGNRARLVLPDPKNPEKSLKFLTEQGFKTVVEAEHAVAMLALKHLGAGIPHERKLPEPYRAMWLLLVGRTDSAALEAEPTSKKGKKKAAWKIKEEEEQARKEALEQALKEEEASQVKKKKTKGVACVSEPVAEVDAGDKLAKWLASIDLGTVASKFEKHGYRDVQQILDDRLEDKKDELVEDYGMDGGQIRKLRRAIHEYRRNLLVQQHNEKSAGASVVAAAPVRGVVDASKPVVKLTSSLKYVSTQERQMTRRKKTEDINKKRQVRENLAQANKDARVYMDDKHRALVESVLRSFGQGIDEIADPISEEVPAELEADLEKLVGLGFYAHHAARALKLQASYAEALDWLCVHLAEDDLPTKFQGKGKHLDVLRFDKNEKPWSNGAEEFLYTSGFDIKEVRSALAASGGHADHALRALCMLPAHQDIGAPSGGEDTTESYLEEESVVLESMYPDSDFSLSVSNENTRIMSMNVKGVPGSTKGALLEVRIAEGVAYPWDSPTVRLIAESWGREQTVHVNRALRAKVLEMQSAVVMYELSVWARSEDVATLVRQYAPHRQSPAPIKQGNSGRAKKHYPASTAPSTFTRRFKSNVTGAENTADTTITPPVLPKRKRRGQPRMSRAARDALGQSLLDDYRAKQAVDGSRYQRMQRTRERLPAAKQAQEVLAAVRQNQVVLISGETGCGKTTQVPQFILDDYVRRGKGGDVNIICTQPRRLAAIGVSERVAAEQDTALGDTVGYQVRMDSKRTEKTRLVFCTTGILLRRLHGDPTVEGVTHILVDEVHERDVDTDFLLAILREVMKKRKDLKIILMSATMDTSLFVRYFNGSAPVVAIPGFVHPIKEYFLEDIEEGLGLVREQQSSKGGMGDDMYARQDSGKNTDYNLLAKTVMYADRIGLDTHDDGAILVFMSGTMEINKAVEAIGRLAKANGRQDKFWVLQLHGSLSSHEQSRVFQRPKQGVRKVVVSTNVAETSITIDDCVFVIDSGKMKEMRYDPYNRMSMLVETWVSKANARQRRGRAGRVRPGHCLRLFRKDQLAAFPAHQSPEIHRVPLERLCLQVLYLEFGQPKEFLGQVIEPPTMPSIVSAVKHLRGLRAFDGLGKGMNRLTPLGFHLASMPVDAQVGKMLIYGAILRCPSQILTIAAAMCTRSPFLQRNESADAAKAKFGAQLMSDHIALLRAFDGYKDCEGERSRRAFCEEHGLHAEGMRQIKDLRGQLALALKDAGFVDGNEMKKLLFKKGWEADADEETQMDYNVLKAALCAGMYPNVARVQLPEKRYQEVSGGAFEKNQEAKAVKLFCKQSSAETTQDPAGGRGKESGPAQDTPKKKHEFDDQRVFLHPSSVLYKQGTAHYKVPWLVYFQKVQTSKVFLRDATMVPAYALLMFGGKIDIMHEHSKLVLDGWMYFDAPARVGVLVRELRKALDELLVRKILQPRLTLSDSLVVDAMLTLLRTNGM